MNASDKTEMSSIHINKHKQTKKQNLTHREKEKEKEKGGEKRRGEISLYHQKVNEKGEKRKPTKEKKFKRKFVLHQREESIRVHLHFIFISSPPE